MNGYLPKPVSRSKLNELLCSLSGMTDNQEQPMHSLEATHVTAVLNQAEVLENLDSDVDFFNELLELFKSHGCQLMDEILKQLQSEEYATGIVEQAHKMKGIASTVGAQQMAAVCLRIQEEEQLADRAVRTRYAAEFSVAQTALLSELDRIGWKVS
jgi:HPt (histidine-containing phosphotransfer) domain-containing protein